MSFVDEQSYVVIIFKIVFSDFPKLCWITHSLEIQNTIFKTYDFIQSIKHI